MIRETLEPCPSCNYPRASHITYTERESPPEIYCSDCGFEWVASRGNLSPDDEATAHRGLRDEAAAYRDPEDREDDRLSADEFVDAVCGVEHATAEALRRDP